MLRADGLVLLRRLLLPAEATAALLEALAGIPLAAVLRVEEVVQLLAQPLSLGTLSDIRIAVFRFVSLQRLSLETITGILLLTIPRLLAAVAVSLLALQLGLRSLIFLRISQSMSFLIFQ
jgi:hypothetical protein